MKGGKKIRINLIGRDYPETWEAGQWGDYSYEGKVFVVKKDGEWVGIYNMDSVISVVVK